MKKLAVILVLLVLPKLAMAGPLHYVKTHKLLLTADAVSLLSGAAAAIATIKEFEALELRDDDRRVFVEALLHPPKPNAALRQAIARHKELGL